MANPWFESVAEAQRRAKRRLPKGVYGALMAGSERGLTVEDNTAAFAELGFAPHTAGLANDKQMATTVMGQDLPAGADQPDRRAGRPPRRRGGRRPRRRRPRHRDGPVARSPASRSRRSSRPTRRPSSRCTGSATAT